MKVFRNFIGSYIDYIMYKLIMCYLYLYSFFVCVLFLMCPIMILGLLIEEIFIVYLLDNIMDQTYVGCNPEIISITDMSDITDTTDISDYVDYIQSVEDIDID